MSRVLRIGEVAALESFVARGTPLAILTAWNPGSVPMTRAANVASQRELLKRLRALGAVTLKARNSAERGAFAEPSFCALGIAIENCDRLARRFGQNAAVTARVGEPARLRVYGAGVDQPFVDWVA